MPESQEVARIEGSYRTPSFEHARVSDAMRAGVIACPADASLRTVARMMATNHVHSVVVTSNGDAPLGVVSERNLLEAARDGDPERTADALATDPVTVSAEDPLPRAAEEMLKSEMSHLVVVDTAGRPLGVVSALDIAGIVGWGLA